MNPASYLSRYLLATIFAIELGYKIAHWSAWVGQFESIQPFPLPGLFITIGVFALPILEGIVVISLIIGKEKFITGLLTMALLLSILIATQKLTLASGAYTSAVSIVRGFLQDQHTWMMLAAGYVAREGWGETKNRS